MPNEPPFVVFVGRLPRNWEQKHVEDYFSRTLRCEILNVNFVRSNSNKCFAYVKLPTKKSLCDALLLDSMGVEGTLIKVDLAESNQIHKMDYGQKQEISGEWRKSRSSINDMRTESRMNSRSSLNSYGSRNSVSTDTSLRSNPFGEATPKDISFQREAKPEIIETPKKAKPRIDPFGGAKPREENIVVKKDEEEEVEKEVEEKVEIQKRPKPSPFADASPVETKFNDFALKTELGFEPVKSRRKKI